MLKWLAISLDNSSTTKVLTYCTFCLKVRKITHIYSNKNICSVIAAHQYVLFKSNLFSIILVPKPTQKQLLQQLYNTVPDKWKPIGIYLEIPEAQLKTIDKQYHGDPQECLMAMLTESWLPRVSPPPTWQDLAEAVEFVGYPDVAQKLRNKFCECHTYSSVKIVGLSFNTSCQTCFIVFYRLTVTQSTYTCDLKL